MSNRNPYRGSTGNPVGRALFEAWRERHRNRKFDEAVCLKFAARKTADELIERRRKVAQRELR